MLVPHMVTLEDQLDLILAPSEQEPLAKNLDKLVLAQ